MVRTLAYSHMPDNATHLWCPCIVLEGKGIQGWVLCRFISFSENDEGWLFWILLECSYLQWYQHKQISYSTQKGSREPESPVQSEKGGGIREGTPFFPLPYQVFVCPIDPAGPRVQMSPSFLGSLSVFSPRFSSTSFPFFPPFQIKRLNGRFRGTAASRL